MNILRVAFVGPSGVGKSTCNNITQKILRAHGWETLCVDVAYPLRKLQKESYKTFNKKDPGVAHEPWNFKQDGKLLGFLAQHFEEEMVSYWKKRIQQCEEVYKSEKVAYINSDCRNNAYEALKEKGFIFIKVSTTQKTLARRREQRRDLTRPDHTSEHEQWSNIKIDHTINNNSSREKLENNIQKLILKLTETNE